MLLDLDKIANHAKQLGRCSSWWWLARKCSRVVPTSQRWHRRIKKNKNRNGLCCHGSDTLPHKQ